MSCSEYSWYHPYGYVCGFTKAVTSGLGGGAVSGIEKELGEGMKRLSDNMRNAFAEAMAKVEQGASETSSAEWGERFAKGFNAFTKGFQDNTNLSSNPDALAAKVAQWINAFSQRAGADLGVNNGVGGKIGDFLNHDFDQFLQKLKLDVMSGRVAEEVSKALKRGIKDVHLGDNVQTIADEFGQAIKVFRENAFRELDDFRNDIQGLVANAARDTSLKVIPWVALASLIMVGTPLAATYVYYKAKHNIGRPKLATEVRRVDLISKAYDAALDTGSLIWRATKNGLKYGGATGVALFGGATAAAATHFFTPLPFLGEASQELLHDTGCHLESFFNNFRRRSSCSHVAPSALLVCGAIGGIAAATLLGREVYDKIQKLVVPEPKPIFSPSLAETIDQIAKATNNLKANGGYLQNVLLCGPGGTGKTMIAKKIARDSSVNYVMMSGGDLAQYIKRGEHVTELNKLFEEAKNSSSPTIIFIDEAESLCRDRDKIDKAELIELLNAFLNHTGESSKKIMLVLATNRLEDLDPAVLSRMDHKLYIGPPAQNERIRILEEYLPRFFSQKEQKEFFDKGVVEKIAQETEGLTGRALFKMLNTLMSAKKGSQNNLLTRQMVDSVVAHFVEQEKLPEEIRNRKQPVALKSNS